MTTRIIQPGEELSVDYGPYYDYENKSLDFDGMLNALKEVSSDDVVLLHACCHNPSGMDLNKEQWHEDPFPILGEGFFLEKITCVVRKWYEIE